MEKEKTKSIKPLTKLQNQLKSHLPFSLTEAQERVLQEIRHDLLQEFPMHRLVQGDVGSGKTIVAALAACSVMENKLQCALMAPTEILAEQHYHNLSRLFNPLGISIALLTGKTKAKEKKHILKQLATGEVLFCIGTHALIQEAGTISSIGFGDYR